MALVAGAWHSPPRWYWLSEAEIETDRQLYDAFVVQLLDREAAGMDRDEAFAETFREFDRGGAT
jgi:hypothetical protein